LRAFSGGNVDRRSRKNGVSAKFNSSIEAAQANLAKTRILENLKPTHYLSVMELHGRSQKRGSSSATRKRSRQVHSPGEALIDREIITSFLKPAPHDRSQSYPRAL
jgi:hypothetical protein